MNAEVVRHVELPGAVRGQPHRRHVAAVIAVAQRDDLEVPSPGARHQQRQVVRLRAGIDEITNLEFAGHLCRQGAAKFGNVRVQIDGGGMLQRFVLLAHRFEHVRMTMADADGGDAGEAVEIAPAFFVPDILAFAFHQHQRLFIKMKKRWIEKFFA